MKDCNTRNRLARVRALRAAYDRIYAPLYLRLLSWPPVRNRVAPYLRNIDVKCLYSAGGTGVNPLLEIRRLAAAGLVRNRDVVLIGVERGDEVGSTWIRYAPRSVIGLDLTPWPESWGKVRQVTGNTQVRCEFVCGDGMRLPLRERSVDLVASQAVIEHVTDVERFLSETHRVLRWGGRIHAFIGPLWHCFGGTHVAELGYDHILLDEDQLLGRARALKTGWAHWLEQGLFNRMKLADYLEGFNRFFQIERLVIVGSPEGAAFKRDYPERWTLLRRTVAEQDLLVRLVAVTAQKVRRDLREKE